MKSVGREIELPNIGLKMGIMTTRKSYCTHTHTHTRTRNIYDYPLFVYLVASVRLSVTQQLVCDSTLVVLFCRDACGSQLSNVCVLFIMAVSQHSMAHASGYDHLRFVIERHITLSLWYLGHRPLDDP